MCFPITPTILPPDAIRNWLASFKRALQTGMANHMVVQRHDVRKPESEGGGFEVKRDVVITDAILYQSDQAGWMQDKLGKS